MDKPVDNLCITCGHGGGGLCGLASRGGRASACKREVLDAFCNTTPRILQQLNPLIIKWNNLGDRIDQRVLKVGDRIA